MIHWTKHQQKNMIIKTKKDERKIKNMKVKNVNKKICLAILCSFILAAGETAEPVMPVMAATDYPTYEEYRVGAGNGVRPGRESEYTVIEITSEEDLAAVALSCSLDTWSRDKYVKLMNDVALQEEAALCIPSFGGIFDGNGYRITNLRITENGSARGLFRYVQEGGIVRNLTVVGVVNPEGSRNQVGGIAGVNYGRIYNCSFSGQVTGDSEVGGIVGMNGETGEIRKCQSRASVMGNHSTGGIVGSNHGTLNNCSNTGDINIHSTEVSYELEDITMENLEDINSTSNISAHTDTGGIAGISDGKIYYCTNEGTVGYNHVGYNVGGIVGRLHQGYLQNCTNTGHVLGRKDVGGIVGQMEPFLEVQYLNGKLQELDRETDKFLDLLDATQADISRYSKQASMLTKNLTTNLKNANAAGGRLLGAANDLWYIYNQELTGINNDWKTLRDDLSAQEKDDKENGNTHDVTVGGGNLPDITVSSGDLPDITVSGGDLPDIAGDGGNLIDKIPGDGVTIEVPNDRESYEAALRKFGESSSSHMDKVTSASADRSGGIRDDLSILNAEMESAGNYLEQLADTLTEGSDQIGGDMDALVEQARVLHRLTSEIRDDLFRYEGITVEDTSDEAASRSVENPGAEPKDGMTQGTGNAITADGAVKSETAADGAAGTMGDNAIDVIGERTDDESLYDTTSFQQGKITLCVNRGVVEADTNVGGIAGQVSTEYDIDPENDITFTGTESFDIERTVKAVVRDSRNLGTVISKKDYAGGIVGKADFGAIISCESYGDVSSTGGSYVGGVAGGSGYAIRSCYSMNHLAGKNYVGGIAGKGCDIFYSYAYSMLDVTGECMGSIAGQVADEGTLYGNYYVAGGMGGIDGIGYQGGATPLTYEELCALDNVPESFFRFTVVFQAEGKELAVYQRGYGESISKEEIPAIPMKEGYYGVWPEFDFGFITSSQVLEVQYEKWVSALKSTEEDADGRAKLLVEGYFLPGYELVADFGEDGGTITFAIVDGESGAEGYTDIERYTEAEGHTNAEEHMGAGGYADTEGYIGAGGYTDAVEVRVLCEKPDKMSVQVQNENGSWEEAVTSIMGTYLVFHMEHPGTFHLTRMTNYDTLIIVAVAVCVMLIVLLVLFIRKGIRKHRARQAVKEEHA